MSVTKQLILIISVLVQLLVMAIFMSQVQLLQHLLERDMHRQLDQTVAQLQGTLSQLRADNNYAKTQQYLADMLTSPRFLKIKLTTLEGEVIFSEFKTRAEGKAPQWFQEAIPLSTQQTSHWLDIPGQPPAHLVTRSQPEYLYDPMWETLQGQLKRDFFYSWYILGVLLLILWPLHRTWSQLSRRAERCQHGDYSVDTKTYWTTDFETLNQCLNGIALQMPPLQHGLRQLHQQLRLLHWTHPHTHLFKRQVMQKMLDHRLSANETGSGGLAVVITLTNLEQYARHHGQPAAIEVLQELAKRLAFSLGQFCQVMVGHYSDLELMACASPISTGSADKIAQEVLEHCQAINTWAGVKEPLQLKLGATVYQQAGYSEDVFTRLEQARRSAHLIRDPLCMQRQAPLPPDANWTQLLQTAIEADNFDLQLQPVHIYQHSGPILFHHEALLKVLDANQQRVFAGIYVDTVGQAQIGSQLDIKVIEKIVTLIETTPGDQRFGVNLSAASLFGAELLPCLAQAKGRLGDAWHRLTLECPESIVLEDPEKTLAALAQLQQLGVQIGLDHVGMTLASYDWLNQAPIGYLKLAGACTRRLDEDLAQQMILRAFIQYAHSEGCKVIATSVETPAERDTLLALEIDGLQGYLIGQPG